MLHFHNDWHLGDILYQLHFQMGLWRDQGIPSALYCNPSMHLECAHFLPDGYAIRLASVAERPPESIDSWIGSGEFYWQHPNHRVYDAFYVDWFQHLAKIAGVESPIKTLSDMDFWSPRIFEQVIPATRFDFLIINAPPRSQQWDYDPTAFLLLAGALRCRRKSMISTHPIGLRGVTATTELGWPVVKIAKLAAQCRCIIAIDTGPVGSTFNIWAKPEARLILHRENSFSREGCHTIRSMHQILPKVKELGLL